MESELDYLKRLKDGIEARMAELEGDEKERPGASKTLSQAGGERGSSATATWNSSQSSSPAQATLALLSDIDKAIKCLDWRTTDYGDWTFRFKAKGSNGQTDEQKILTDAIKGADGKLVVGKMEYTLPEGKPFISRRALKK